MSWSLVGLAGLATTFVQLFDKLLWRWKRLHPWFVPQPMIQGTWQGWITSDYVNPATNEPAPRIRAYFRIKQTYFNVYLRLMTAESASNLLSGKLYFNDDGTFVIAGLYLNTPKPEVRERSPIHHGGIMLHLRGDPVERLDGPYFTDRKTGGSLQFDEKVSELCDGFTEAEKAFARKGQQA
jgi:hypothetical protein